MCQSFSLSLYHLYFSLILLLLSVQLSPEAFSGGPRDAGKKSRGCLSLKIGHSRNELPGQTPQPVVTARLLNTSTHPVECYTPGAKHFGECLSNLCNSSYTVCIWPLCTWLLSNTWGSPFLKFVLTGWCCVVTPLLALIVLLQYQWPL